MRAPFAAHVVPTASLSNDIAEALTANERRVIGCAPAADRWAGRLAAKRAVCSVLGLDPTYAAFHEVEIVPRRDGSCFDPARCRQGHRPDVCLHGEVARVAAGRQVAVSISHDRDVAFAVAMIVEGDDG